MLPTVAPKPKTNGKRNRAPRIRVPNNERAIFVVDEAKFLGVIQRLSLTGGSAVMAKGPIAPGAMGELMLNTVYGKVNAQIEFLHTGADGVPLAQAFRFLAMDDTSTKRFNAAARKMQEQGFSDAPKKVATLQASEGLNLLLQSVRRLAATMGSGSSTGKR
jgi:hypothetical protein